MRCKTLWLFLVLSTLYGIWWHRGLGSQPLRLQRRAIARLPKELSDIALTDLDGDGRVEVLVACERHLPGLILDPLKEPKALTLPEGLTFLLPYGALPLLKALPVLTRDKKLRFLRLRGKQFVPEPFTPPPDEPIDAYGFATFGKERTYGALWVQPRGGKAIKLFVLKRDGNWQFAGHFPDSAKSLGKGRIVDLDKDGKVDWLGLDGTNMWQVIWGGKRGKTALSRQKVQFGAGLQFGLPLLVDDLDGDGWLEVAFLGDNDRLQVWRFDPKKQKLRVVAASPTLIWGEGPVELQLFDLDGDGHNELVVMDYMLKFGLSMAGRPYAQRIRVFKLTRKGLVWREGIWSEKATPFSVPQPTGGFGSKVISDGRRRLFVKSQSRMVWAKPKTVRFMYYAAFWELPKGKAALSPRNWRLVWKAPSELWFPLDLDGDGVDELLMMEGDMLSLWNKQGKKWARLEQLASAIRLSWKVLQEGKRQALVLGHNDGRVEVVTTAETR